VLIKIIISPQQ